jgi:hypothetical protein
MLGSGSAIRCAVAVAVVDFGMLRFATLAQEVIGMNDLTNCVSMQSDV